jgi:hypothetical protein
MDIDPAVRDRLAVFFFDTLAPHLDEKQVRLCAGVFALACDEHAVAGVVAASGLADSTVRSGMADVLGDGAPIGRVRRPGGGRAGIEQVYPGLWPALDALIEPEERGDPENPLRWTVKSTRTLAEELGRQGFAVSHVTVSSLLHDHGFSLRGTAKVLQGVAAHGPDRDAQFRHINDTTKAFLADGQPVISVDTKKKEMLGNFDRPGLTWRPYQDPVQVEDHSFATDSQVTAIPYGVYDIGANRGFVNVGVSHDTPTFAVASLRLWWELIGHEQYPNATRLLIVADAGGSNAARSLVFKTLLHELAVATGLAITVAHTPPGTSKWNKVEHRLFAQISSTWRGRPLTSLQVVRDSIAATVTRGGLRVECVVDHGHYPTGVTSSWDVVDTLPIRFGDFRGEWNYTVAPGPADPAGAAGRKAQRAARTTARTPQKSPATLGDADQRAAMAAALTTPEVTGIGRREWGRLTVWLEPAYREVREQQAEQARNGQPSAYPGRQQRALKADITLLMLAAVLHIRYRLPAAQVSRLLDLNSVGLKKHINNLIPLFEQFGHPISPSADTFKKFEQLLAAVLPPTPAQHAEVTT